MFRVTYTLYGKISKERTFDNEAAARGFFYGYCVKTPNITKARLEAV